MADERPAKRQRLTSRVVTVKVGEEPATDFTIHEDILIKHSKFFKAALSKQWREGQSLIIELPEDDPESFAAYAEWLYDERRLRTALGHLYKLSPIRSKLKKLDVALAKTYVLGEKMLDAKFCNAIIDLLFKNIGNWKHELEVVNILYEGTAPGSPARRFVVDIWVAEAFYEEDCISDGDQIHPDFVRDLANGFMMLRKIQRDYIAPKMVKSWLQPE